MNAFYINVILISNLFRIPLYAGLLFLLAETITPAWAAEAGLNQQKLAEIQKKLMGCIERGTGSGRNQTTLIICGGFL